MCVILSFVLKILLVVLVPSGQVSITAYLFPIILLRSPSLKALFKETLKKQLRFHDLFYFCFYFCGTKYSYSIQNGLFTIEILRIELLKLIVVMSFLKKYSNIVLHFDRMVHRSLEVTLIHFTFFF